jgi:hypothetical protein
MATGDNIITGQKAKGFRDRVLLPSVDIALNLSPLPRLFQFGYGTYCAQDNFRNLKH